MLDLELDQVSTNDVHVRRSCYLGLVLWGIVTFLDTVQYYPSS